MPKNIVICCDGTANQFTENKTNVLKLFSVLDQNAPDQVAYYHPGLGTMEPSGALSTFARKLTILMGKAIGYGLDLDIRDAYVFLMQNYQPEDKVYFFGFSRGAYTVRAVAALLNMYGLIRCGNEALVPYAIRMMIGMKRSESKDQAQADAMRQYFELAAEFKRTMSIPCTPWFVGVWDTVSSVGWIDNPLKLPYISNNPDIEIGRHAIAIDEKRAFFRTNLWHPSTKPQTPAGPKDLKQVWFPGVHCDVGGGYAEAESGLSKIALEWMLGEAEAAGLRIDAAKKAQVLGKAPGSKCAPPDPNGMAHESLNGLWVLAEFLLKKHYNWKTGKVERRMNLFRRRTIPENSLVHQSAFQRSGNYRTRLPKSAIQVP
jgi:uncharacterized protein (DUF2235 family)